MPTIEDLLSDIGENDPTPAANIPVEERVENENYLNDPEENSDADVDAMLDSLVEGDD